MVDPTSIGAVLKLLTGVNGPKAAGVLLVASAVALAAGPYFARTFGIGVEFMGVVVPTAFLMALFSFSYLVVSAINAVAVVGLEFAKTRRAEVEAAKAKAAAEAEAEAAKERKEAERREAWDRSCADMAHKIESLASASKSLLRRFCESDLDVRRLRDERDQAIAQYLIHQKLLFVPGRSAEIGHVDSGTPISLNPQVLDVIEERPDLLEVEDDPDPA